MIEHMSCLCESLHSSLAIIYMLYTPTHTHRHILQDMEVVLVTEPKTCKYEVPGSTQSTTFARTVLWSQSLSLNKHFCKL